MTVNPAVPADPRWSFWAPASDELIQAALDLAGVRPGDRFLDLGCGDGRVLVAAGRRGARVRGIEIDAALAQASRRSLNDAGIDGHVELGDMFSASLEADVVYAYLTPATLGKLRPALTGCRPGTRIVAPRYAITGWEHEVYAGRCHLYRLPARPAPAPVRLGWPWRGAVVVLPADRRCLVPLALNAGPGPVSLELDGPLARGAHWAIGAGGLEGPRCVPVDLVFNAFGAGSVIAGSVRASDAEITVAAVFAPDGFGQWGFGPGEGIAFRQMLDAKIAAVRSRSAGATP